MSEDNLTTVESLSSQNTTVTSALFHTEPRWIAGEIMLLVIALVTIYVFTALMHYSWRFRNMARVSGSEHEMRERYLHYSCAAVILMAIARCVLHQVVVFSPSTATDVDHCRTMMMTSRIVYNLAICLTYVHLWLRQRMFYTKDELKHLRTKVLECVDWIVLVIIILSSAVLAFIAFVPLDGNQATVTYHEDLCNVFEYNSKVTVKLYAGLALTFQFALMGLYLYPIINQYMQQRRENQNPLKPNQAMSVYPALWSGIKRSFILTVVIIVTDAVAATLVWILTKNYPEILSSIIALNDVNLIINVVCAICTFRNWRKIVFGFPVCRRIGWQKDAILRLKKPLSPELMTTVVHDNDVDSDAYNSHDFDSLAEVQHMLAENTT